jgi:hypothetical protein
MSADIYTMNDKSVKLTRDAISSSRKYTAFKAANQEIYRVKIRPRLRAWERLQYSQLWRILENGYGTEIGLVFPFAIVEIIGRNLQPVGDALDRHSCDFIQEYDEGLWDLPGDPKEPFVESIQITTESREQIVRASDALLSRMDKK